MSPATAIWLSGGRVEGNRSHNRLQIFFGDKPDEETRAALKSNDFRGAPSVGAWQRQLNDNAIYTADRLDCIRPLNGESPSELQKRVRLERQTEDDKPEPIPDLDNSEEQGPDVGMQMY